MSDHHRCPACRGHGCDYELCENGEVSVDRDDECSTCQTTQYQGMAIKPYRTGVRPGEETVSLLCDLCANTHTPAGRDMSNQQLARALAVFTHTLLRELRKISE